MRLALSTALLLAASSVGRPGCGGREQPPRSVCDSPDPCAGKACGTGCAAPEGPCGSLAPVYLGQCDAAGACVRLSDAPPICAPSAECAGKACGTACDPCGGACASPVASACDYRGVCAPASPWACYDPCAGKACGIACSICPPGAASCGETGGPKACDAQGHCVLASPAPACP